MPRKIRGSFCEETIDRSLKVVGIRKSGSSWIYVGCPRGKLTKTGRCRVGTGAYKILHRRKKGSRCPAGMKAVRK